MHIFVILLDIGRICAGYGILLLSIDWRYCMRTRFLPRLLNDEVEKYLERNDTIIVPVGTVELHGGFPLDAETVASEAIAMKMAESCDALVLSGLPYFYAGATATGRGTVQVSVRTGIDYLFGIAESLLRQGFRRQIYISFHGPAHITISPVVRDFMDRYGVPILYLDLTMQLFSKGGILSSIDDFHAVTAGAYDILGRLDDIPLTTEYEHAKESSVKRFSVLSGLAYESGATGYYFGEKSDHMSTPAIATAEERKKLAENGKVLIDKLVKHLDMPSIVSCMRDLDEFEKTVMERYPWVPAAFRRSVATGK